VTDHRISLTLHSLQEVMEGRIQEIVNALNEREIAQKEMELSLT
jgi:protein subunit release factor A